MNNKKTNIFIFCILAAVLAYILMLYPTLPDTIPTHFDAAGQINGYGSKNTLFFIWALTAVVNIIMPLSGKIDPKKENYEKFKSFFNLFRIIFTAFMSFVILLVIKFGKHHEIKTNITFYVMLAVGVFLVFLGNYMPKVKQNYFFGIKTPWTLANENVWNKTHRFAGPLWICGGIIIPASCLLDLNGVMRTVIIVAVTLVIGLLPEIYSYIIFKKEENNN